MVYSDGVLSMSDGSNGQDVVSFVCSREELRDMQQKVKEGIPNDRLVDDTNVPNEWRAVFDFNTMCGFKTLLLRPDYGIQIARLSDIVVCVKYLGVSINRQVNFMMSNEQFIEDFCKLG